MVSVRGACVVVAASVMLAVALVGISGDIEAELWAVIVELTVIFCVPDDVAIMASV